MVFFLNDHRTLIAKINLKNNNEKGEIFTNAR